MIVRNLIVLAAVIVFSNGLLAQQHDTPIKTGDHIFIRMTGELAKEYARLTDSPRNDGETSGYSIETSATIVQNLDDGRIRIERSVPLKRAGKPDRYLTLTATVDKEKLKTDVTPKGAASYASPAEYKNGAQPKLTTEDSKSLRLELSELKGLKLRTWTLAEEIGE